MTLRVRALAATASLLLPVLAGGQGLPPTAAPAGVAPLVGRWSTELPHPGGAPPSVTVTYRPDGTHEASMTALGEVVGWWRGTCMLAPDRTLILNETAASPELCFRGQCRPNEAPTGTIARIGIPGATSYTAWYVDSATRTPLTFRRVAAPLPGAPPTGPAGPATAPGAPVPTAPVPIAPTPTAPRTGPSGAPPTDPPAPPEAGPWIGAWSDGDVTIRLGGSVGDVLEFEGRTMPLMLSGDDRRLDGTVQDVEGRYAITLERVPAGLVATADGFTLLLSPEGPDVERAPPGSGRPPGN